MLVEIDLRLSLSLSLPLLVMRRIATVSDVRKIQAEKIISSNQRDESRADGTREAIPLSAMACCRIRGFLLLSSLKSRFSQIFLLIFSATGQTDDEIQISLARLDETRRRSICFTAALSGVLFCAIIFVFCHEIVQLSSFSERVSLARISENHHSHTPQEETQVIDIEK